MVAAITFSPLVLALIAMLALLILPPVIYLLRSSLQQTNFDGSLGAFTLLYYRDLLQTDRLLPVIATSAAYAGGSALVALLLGGIQAWIVERTDTPLRALVMIVSILSLGIPSVLYTISFLLLLGKTGPLNQVLMWATGAETPPFNVYSLGGMILIQGIEYTPLCFLLLSSVLRSSEIASGARLLSSAQTPGAARWGAGTSPDALRSGAAAGCPGLSWPCRSAIFISTPKTARIPARASTQRVGDRGSFIAARSPARSWSMNTLAGAR